jgi:predicted DNA-binding protein with PD1-like motif
VKSHAAPARVSVKPAFTPVKSVGEARAATASHAAWARSVAEVVAPSAVAASPGMIPDGLTQGVASVVSPSTASSGVPSTHVLRMSPGDDLRAGLVKAFADLSRTHGVAAGCVLSSVGSLSRAVLRYAAEDRGTEIVAPLELITLSGTLSPGGVHLHASIADAQGRMTGGHLMPGCIVRTTAEVVIALLPEWAFGRDVDAATGFKELVVRRVL